jgi:heme o synthase
MRRGAVAIAADYLALTKPKVMLLLLFTTLMAMLIAQRGLPPLALVIATLAGGALSAGAAGAFNMYVDRDIDALMRRTKERPIPGGRVAPQHALLFGLVLTLSSFALLACFVNLLAALLALGGMLFYVFVYTVWLKRRSVQNIVIGGAAGAVPPLVGWAAVTDHVGLTAVALFLIVFVWTPPHFWALALIAKDEYARARVPMLPVMRGDDATKRAIVAYSVALAALTLALTPLKVMGTTYLLCALVLDALFLVYALRVRRDGSVASERAMYKFSMLYLALLFGAMVVDRAAHALGV